MAPMEEIQVIQKNSHLLFSLAVLENFIHLILSGSYSFFRPLNYIFRVIFRPLEFFAKNFAPLKNTPTGYPDLKRTAPYKYYQLINYSFSQNFGKTAMLEVKIK